MKHAFMLFLGLSVVLMTACGGSSETGDQAGAATGANTAAASGGERIGDSLSAAYDDIVKDIPELSGFQEKRDFLLNNYSTDTLQKKYIEIVATNEADKLFYFEGDPAESTLSEDEKMNRWGEVTKSLEAKYTELGLNYDLYVSLNLLAGDEGWNLKFEDMISARAAEINAERKK